MGHEVSLLLNRELGDNLIIFMDDILFNGHICFDIMSFTSLLGIKFEWNFSRFDLNKFRKKECIELEICGIFNKRLARQIK